MEEVTKWRVCPFILCLVKFFKNIPKFAVNSEVLYEVHQSLLLVLCLEFSCIDVIFICSDEAIDPKGYVPCETAA